MNARQKRAAALAAAQAIVEGAKSAVRSMTTEEKSQVEAHLKEVDDLDVQIKDGDADQARLSRLTALTPAAKAGHTDEQKEVARTLGDHFIKHVGSRLAEIRGVKGASVSAPEWVKAASDNQVTNGGIFSPVLTEVDRTIITGVRPRMGRSAATPSATSWRVRLRARSPRSLRLAPSRSCTSSTRPWSLTR